jgi:hypothetical protein
VVLRRLPRGATAGLTPRSVATPAAHIIRRCQDNRMRATSIMADSRSDHRQSTERAQTHNCCRDSFSSACGPGGRWHGRSHRDHRHVGPRRGVVFTVSPRSAALAKASSW